MKLTPITEIRGPAWDFSCGSSTRAHHRRKPALDLVRTASKRAIDIVGALIALLLLSPLMLLIALALTIFSRGPILYSGMRIGRYGRPFRMYKFRTMVPNAEPGSPASTEDDPRITPVGRVLRRNKLDELPQLLNVLFGQMSLVGPRPQVAANRASLSVEETLILQIRPGLTDWASLWNFNEGAVLQGATDPQRAYDRLILPTKIAWQLLYLCRHPLSTDLKILLYTVCKLLCPHWTPRELAPGSTLCKQMPDRHQPTGPCFQL